MGMAMQQTKQSTPFRSGATHASSPVLMVGAKPVKPWLVLTAVLFGFFMAVLDMTIMNIAIPSIQTGLKADLLSTSWVLNAYNLMYAVLLITIGRFADQYGRKRLLLIAMILFSLGSLGCALAQACGRISGAPAMSWLIGFRALQGVGAAGLTPVSLAIMMVVFPRQKRGAALGVWGAVGGMGAAFGPLIGGFLVQTFDWRWIFLVNLPNLCSGDSAGVALCAGNTRPFCEQAYRCAWPAHAHNGDLLSRVGDHRGKRVGLVLCAHSVALWCGSGERDPLCSG